MAEPVHNSLLRALRDLSPGVLQATVTAEKFLTIDAVSVDEVQRFRRKWRALPPSHPVRRKLDRSDVSYRIRPLKAG